MLGYLFILGYFSVPGTTFYTKYLLYICLKFWNFHRIFRFYGDKMLVEVERCPGGCELRKRRRRKEKILRKRKRGVTSGRGSYKSGAEVTHGWKRYQNSVYGRNKTVGLRRFVNWSTGIVYSGVGFLFCTMGRYHVGVAGDTMVYIGLGQYECDKGINK